MKTDGFSAQCIGSADASKGTVLFVESIRWLNVRWGLRPCLRGLRDAGFEGQVHYIRWHATWRGVLVLPVIMDAGLLHRQATQLSELIAQTRRRKQGAPLHIIGYSAGAYLALRALELLPVSASVTSVALLAGAFDPRRNLGDALARIETRLVNVSSLLDCMVLGVGTSLFGNGDRRYGLSSGMVGLRGREAAHAKVRQIVWRPRMMTKGWFGGHFTAASRELIAKHVAPAMGIGR